MPEEPPAGGQELTNWRLTSIENKIDALGSNYVPVGIYNVNQKNIEEAFVRAQEAAAENKAAIDGVKAKLEAQQDQIEKNRKQFWTSVSVGALLLVLGIFVTPITRALGLTP